MIENICINCVNLVKCKLPIPTNGKCVELKLRVRAREGETLTYKKEGGKK